MDTYRRSGIVTGILFIVATAAGTLSLLWQPHLNAPDCMTNISVNEPTVFAAALLVFIMGWSGAAEFRVIEGVFDCIGAVLILLLATLRRESIKAGPAGLAQFQSLGALLREGRTCSGDAAALPAWCIAAYLYYSLFYKTRLVPRWLSLWGLVGITLTMAARASSFSSARSLLCRALAW
jgi:hypothetical protein